ncbi:phage late control D family protein [Psychrobacter lutiphocae]|uniref:phage late control D family protein n=1 Tax=Psychrobacter lutiphocae TaxID=540500 RepID=UPI000365B0A5|nr:contractile injection system protein, VgrG/Pvc8 family [Psychrobacter lutiphocae]
MIKTPAFTLLYDNKNATIDIAEYMTDARYTDHLTGTADELDITLSDPKRRWMDIWYPNKGATLKFSIGYEGGDMLDCGTFEIDEITVNDSPNTVQIRALSAGVNTPLRTKQYRAFDDQTLDQVIKKVADDLGFSIEGKIEPLPIERITQQETDLAFIKRLAEDYGYIVKIRNKRLIFSHAETLKMASSVTTIDRTDVMRGWNMREQIRDVPKETNVTKHNPKRKNTVKGSAKHKTKTIRKSSNTKTKTKTKSKAKPKLVVYDIQDGKLTKS